ncbi:MAG: hypothetical protein NT031_06785 [Planctomycetota bacterium]|nr:hypothetical protein [Planctomycetota bacterium]
MAEQKKGTVADAVTGAKESRPRRWWRLLGTMVLPLCAGGVLTAGAFVWTPLGRWCQEPDMVPRSSLPAPRAAGVKAARKPGVADKAPPAQANEDALAQLRQIEQLNRQNRQRIGIEPEPGAGPTGHEPGAFPAEREPGRAPMRRPGTPLPTRNPNGWGP